MAEVEVVAPPTSSKAEGTAPPADGISPSPEARAESLLESLQQALAAPDPEDAAARFTADLQAFLADKPSNALRNLADRLSLVGGPTPTVPEMRSILESEGLLTPERALQVIDLLAHALHADRTERLRVAYHLEREHSDHVNRRVLLKRRISLLENRLSTLEKLATTDTVLPPGVIDIDPDEEAVLARQAEAAARAVHEAYEARMERDAARAGAEVLQVELKRSWTEVERLMDEVGRAQEEVAEISRSRDEEAGRVQAARATVDVLAAERDRLIAHTRELGGRISELEVYRDRLEQIRNLPPLRFLRQVKQSLTRKG